MADQAEVGLVANLCELCSIVERIFFCALSSLDGRRHMLYHKSLDDLVKSASDGCDLCNVFLHGYLHKQLAPVSAVMKLSPSQIPRL